MCENAPIHLYKTGTQPCMYAHLLFKTLFTKDMAGSLLELVNGDVLLCAHTCNDGCYLSNVLLVDHINQCCNVLITFPFSRDKPDGEKFTMKRNAQPAVAG